MKFNLYLPVSSLICFEGDDAAATQAAADAAAATAAAAAAAQKGKTFTQDEINRLMAEERRKNQAILTKAEQNYTAQLANFKGSDEDKARLQEELDNLQAQSRTKEEQAKIELARASDAHSRAMKAEKDRADRYEKMYTESTIARELTDAAAAAGAFSPSQVVTILRGNTKLTSDGKVVVDFIDKAVDGGEPVAKQFSPKDMVARMMELPDDFGNLFRSTNTGGLGGSGSGSAPLGTNGKVDLNKIDGKRYLELKGTPEGRKLLGLPEKAAK